MSDRPSTRLIRLYCDCELTPEQAASLQRCLESETDYRREVVDQVEAERRLRQCVERVLKCSCERAPAELRDSIKSSIALAGAEASRSDSNRRLNLAAIFSSPHRANALAVAATIALVVGAVLFGIFGRTIDQVPVAPPADLVATAAVFADQEHGPCSGDSRTLHDEANILTPSEAEADLQQWLGAPVRVFDLSELGYEFAGAGRCKMPVPAPSGHLLYIKPGSSQQRAMVSVFIVAGNGGCQDKLCKDLKPGQWCPAAAERSGCMHTVLQGTDGRLAYFLVCCDERDLEGVKQRITLVSAPSAR
jgi:hypothetical protein